MAAAPVDTWKAYFRVMHGSKAVGRAYLGFEKNDEGERYETRQAATTAWGRITRKTILQVDEKGKPARLQVVKMEQVAGSQLRMFTRYDVRPVAGGLEVTTTQFGVRWTHRVKAPGALPMGRSPLLLAYFAARRLGASAAGTVLDLDRDRVVPFHLTRSGSGAGVRVTISLKGRGGIEGRFDARWAKLLGARGQGRIPGYRKGGKPPALVPPPRGFGHAVVVKPFSWPAGLRDLRLPIPRRGASLLAARLTLPSGGRKPPVVILVPAADARDRDGTNGQRRFYAELAARLGQSGFAVVRYAPQGVKPTGGDRAKVTLKTWMADLDAVVASVRRDRRIDRRRIFLLGHGEGGLQALRFAVRKGYLLRGVALLSTPGVEYSAYILDQWRRRWETAGMAVSVVNQRLAWFRSQLNLAAKGQRKDFLGRPGGVIADLLKIDPLKAFQRVRLRTLILAGQADSTVRQDDVNALRAAMGRNHRITVARPEGVGHLLQHSPRFLELSEMWKVPAPISPAASKPLVDWLRRQSR